ncbi:MAG TPA: hypothetical protein DDW50_13005 [Firmicutes bacterium]|nr:hypothetical protein [Bacillota bacterium]
MGILNNRSFYLRVFPFTSFPPFTEAGGYAPPLVRTNMAVAFGSLCPIASQKAMDGEDKLKALDE